MSDDVDVMEHLDDWEKCRAADTVVFGRDGTVVKLALCAREPGGTNLILTVATSDTREVEVHFLDVRAIKLNIDDISRINPQSLAATNVRHQQMEGIGWEVADFEDSDVSWSAADFRLRVVAE
jgi:hypothetical protein